MSAPFVIRTSNATAPVLRALCEAFAHSGGFDIELIVESSSIAPQTIKAGARGDIAILQEDSINQLEERGVFRQEDCFVFAHSPIGLAVRKGAPRPPIATVDDAKRTLLAARAIAHTQFGPSGRYFAGLMRRLGIAEEIKRKEVTRPGGYIAQLVVDGEADLAFQQMGELLAVDGVDILGPLPHEIQSAIVSKAAIFADSQHAARARALLEFFARPENAAIFSAAELEQAG